MEDEKVGSERLAKKDELLANREDGNRKKKHIFLAFFTVLSLAISRGCGAQLKYSILNDQPEHFYPPFLLMWFNNCCLLACFPGYLLFTKMTAKGKQMSYREICAESALIFSSKDGFRIGRFLCLELFFLLLFNANNYSNSLSLGLVSTSASLTIHSVEVSLVYVLGRLFLGEHFVISRTLGVFLATGGIILIAADNKFAADLLGVFFSIFACISGSVHKVCFKRLAGDASLGQSSLFLSGMGLVNLFVNIVPAYLLLHFGLEKFDFVLIPWPKLLVFMGLTFVFNFSTIFGLALLSPVVVAIGMLCGVPLSFGIDLAFRRLPPTWTFLLGAALLLLSTILAIFHDQIQIKCRLLMGARRKRRNGGDNDAAGSSRIEGIEQKEQLAHVVN